jgi:quercetin 2,3-dioxygenase
MISLRLAAERHHDRRLKRDVWRTFDPVNQADRVADCFGALEALDESRLPPRADVPRRLGDDGEVITYVREGTVAYDDSTGQVGMIHAGEFQRMITAQGIRHCETNASRIAWAHVFQFRMRRSTARRERGREQKRFSTAERRGVLCVVASPDARDGSLRLDQDTWIYSGLLAPGQHVVHELAPTHAAWLHVVQGEVTLGDLVLTTGDGAGVVTERAVSLTARVDSEILLFDLAERTVSGP